MRLDEGYCRKWGGRGRFINGQAWRSLVGGMKYQGGDIRWRVAGMCGDDGVIAGMLDEACFPMFGNVPRQGMLPRHRWDVADLLVDIRSVALSSCG
jgi:hypothetical protein